MYFSCRLLRRQRGIQPCDLYALLRFSASAQAEGTFHVFCTQCFLQRSAGWTERAIQFADSVRRSLCDSCNLFLYLRGKKSCDTAGMHINHEEQPVFWIEELCFALLASLQSCFPGGLSWCCKERFATGSK